MTARLLSASDPVQAQNFILLPVECMGAAGTAIPGNGNVADLRSLVG